MGNKQKPEGKKRLLAVQLSLKDLLEFYKMCNSIGIKSKGIMTEALVIYCKMKQSKGMRVWSTSRTKEDFIKHLSGEYGKTLYLKDTENKEEE